MRELVDKDGVLLEFIAGDAIGPPPPEGYKLKVNAPALWILCEGQWYKSLKSRHIAKNMLKISTLEHFLSFHAHKWEY